MNWLAKIRIYLGHDQPSPEFPTVDDPAPAAALENARAALGEAKERRIAMREVSSSLADLRARNHFGESIELAMMRRDH